MGDQKEALANLRRYQYRTKVSADVTIYFDENDKSQFVLAHSTVLESKSRFFAERLPRLNSKEMCITDVSQQHFKLLLSVLYGEWSYIKIDNVQELKRLAEKYNCDEVDDEINKLDKRIPINLSNIWKYRQLTELAGGISQNCAQFLKENAMELIEHENFLSASSETMLIILSGIPNEKRIEKKNSWSIHVMGSKGVSCEQ